MTTTDTPPPITADQLAQARGCETWNECYGDCIESAQRVLGRWADLDAEAREDVQRSADWVARQKWVP